MRLKLHRRDGGGGNPKASCGLWREGQGRSGGRGPARRRGRRRAARSERAVCRYQPIHSLGCARVSQEVAPAVGAIDDSAYICGLLHDIGKIPALLFVQKALGKGKEVRPEFIDALVERHHVRASVALIGHWKFNETTGTTAFDSSGQGNNGTTSGSPVAVSGKLGQALQFDGVDDEVDISAVADDIGTGNLTMSTWVKFPNALSATSEYAV
ncbi:MAG: HDOD domain-containing protein, partial [Deltaproteobacteria bacterium]|nr:HDOD domain-containing protein [Deltaproteobacteria bacterium]